MHTVLSSWSIRVTADDSGAARDAVSELEGVDGVEVEALEEEMWSLLKLESRLSAEGDEQGPDPESLSEVKADFRREVEELLAKAKMEDLTQEGEDRYDNQASASAGSAGAEALQWVRAQNDKLGLGIDAGVEHPVAAMRVLGVRTTQSCEGHEDHGLPYPWIDVEPEDLPYLQQALQKHPLPGFGVEHERRLMPQGALGLNPFALMPQRLPDVEVELDSETRQRLLLALEDNRAALQRWSQRVLQGEALFPSLTESVFAAFLDL